MTPFPTIAMHTLGQVASHNTYDTTDWTSHFTDVNAVELDVWPLSGWIVCHNFDPAGARMLVDYMYDLSKWHKANPDHDLLTVFIEIKSREGWKVGDFESIIRGRFNDSRELFRPTDLGIWGRDQKGYYDISLKGSVQTNGWPEVTSLKNKIMFVINGGGHVTETYLAERPLFNTVTGTWSTEMGVAPICFMMSTLNDQRDGSQFIVLFNEKYNDFPALITRPADNCLRRAYQVDVGNDDMVKGNLVPAQNAMKDKYINYLAYDQTKNAFWMRLP